MRRQTTATPPATLSLTGDCVRREVECPCLDAGSSELLAVRLISNAGIFLAPSLKSSVRLFFTPDDRKSVACLI
jgi:hypothetical protein